VVLEVEVLEVDLVCRCRCKGPEARFNERRSFIGKVNGITNQSNVELAYQFAVALVPNFSPEFLEVKLARQAAAMEELATTNMEGTRCRRCDRDFGRKILSCLWPFLDLEQLPRGAISSSWSLL
jgi:hypothetical protein